MQLSGAFTALVTPFKNGKIDEEAYRNLIEWQIEEGINGVVPCGTTGESATLSHDEHEQVVSICIDQVRKRVPVIAGAGSNNTAEAISLLKFAKKAGADVGLVITPYYNKPTQEGLYQHYKALNDIGLPMVLYNVPGRTGVNTLPSTLARIAKDLPMVIGVKEATANLIQVSDYVESCPKKFNVLVGDDFTVLSSIVIGVRGVISVSSNVAPKLMADLCKYALAGDYEKAKECHYKLAPINRACFIETNPGPVKAGLAMMGKMTSDFRLPMVYPQAETAKIMEKALKDAKII